MPQYSYRAINQRGKDITGTLEAESKEKADEILSEQGNIPLSITEQKNVTSRNFNLSEFADSFTPIKALDLILFTKQFKTLTRAGVSMLDILQILENQTENKRLKSVLGGMGKDIKEGSSLYEAFGKRPKVFSPFYSSMIRAGEASGSLPEVLDKLTYVIEHEHKIKAEIASALRYPLIVLFFLAFAFFFLLTFVIPKFVAIFQKASIELPMPTKICLMLYDFMLNSWFLVLPGVFLGVILVVYFLKTKKGGYIKDYILLRTPIIGELMIKAAMSRFASIFAILHYSGVAILESMDILSKTIGNHAISREFDLIKERMSEGKGISGPLKSAKFFPPLAINMISIGEKSGKLEEMLDEISSHFDSELEYTMKKFSDAIGPLLIVLMAVVVGFFALAMFLPMWDMTKTVG